MAQTRSLEPARYEFAPADRGGIALGLDGVQLTITVVTLFGVTGALRGGVPLWLVAPVAGPFLVFGSVRMGGQRVTTLAARWAGWWLRPRKSSAGPLITTARSDGHGAEAAERVSLRPPPWAKGLELLEVPYGDGDPVGVWRDGTALAVVMRAEAPATALRDLAEQETLAAIWGDLLSTAGVEGSPVQRLAWLARTAPDSGADAAAWLRDHADPTVGLSDPGGEPGSRRDLSPVWDSYTRVGDAVGSTAAARDLLVVVRVEPDRARNRLRGARGEARRALAAELAVGEAERVGRRLIEIGCHAEFYKPEALAAMVRTTFDPSAREELAWYRAAADDPEAGVSPASGMWPLSHTETADHVRTDGGFHRVAWIEEWPTTPVGVGWLHPLLLPSTSNRIVSMVMEPIPMHTAERTERRAVAAADSDAEVMSRSGRRPTARSERTRAAAEQREQELVDGHRDMHFAGFVLVTGRTLEELEDTWATTMFDAGRARLRLRPLHGEHWPALAAVLPLGRFF